MSSDDRYDSLFQFYAERYNLNWKWIKAQAKAESALNPMAKSPVGASGLMQFMAPTWAEWWEIVHPGKMLASRTDAERSIQLGCAYMAFLIERFGSLQHAQIAYNWGMGNLRRHLDHHGDLVFDQMPAETRLYVGRIAAYHAELEREIT